LQSKGAGCLRHDKVVADEHAHGAQVRGGEDWKRFAPCARAAFAPGRADLVVAPDFASITTEEEGVALAAGAWLGGDKSVLLMQSSGVGNCINMLSMLSACQIPLTMLVTMRGDWAEFNPWQVPMGQATQPVLEEMGVLVNRADREEDIVPLAEGALRIAYNTLRPTAVLIGQRLLGAKTFDN